MIVCRENAIGQLFASFRKPFGKQIVLNGRNQILEFFDDGLS